MYDASITNTILTPCTHYPTYDDYVNNGYVTVGCGSQLAARYFFITHFILIYYVILELLIAVIIH